MSPRYVWGILAWTMFLPFTLAYYAILLLGAMGHRRCC